MFNVKVESILILKVIITWLRIIIYVKQHIIIFSEMRDPAGTMLSPTNSIQVESVMKPGVVNLPVVVVYGFKLQSFRKISLSRVKLLRVIHWKLWIKLIMIKIKQLVVQLINQWKFERSERSRTKNHNNGIKNKVWNRKLHIGMFNSKILPQMQIRKYSNKNSKKESDYFDDLKHSNTDVKSKWIEGILRNGSRYWSQTKDLIKRVVWESGIRDLRKLKLYNTDDSQDKEEDLRYFMGCFKRLPDIREFSIKLGNYDWLMARFGLKKRLKPTLTWIPYNNKKMNRYLEHQIRILDRCIEKGNDRLYWSKSMFLVKRSRTFFLTQLRRTFPRWHREFPLWWVINLYKKYLLLARNNACNMQVRRVFIDKDAKSKRPLGVPNAAWRLYLGLVNQFAQHFLKNKISNSQHAYMYGKGTLTAWTEIISKVISSENIFEFDLKGFFPSVDLLKLKPVMEKYGVPRDIANMIFALNTRLPVGIYKTTGTDGKPLSEEEQEILNRSEVIVRDPLHVWSFREPSNEDKYVNVSVKGMAQGSPLSPLMSLLALEETLFKWFPGKVIMYADDGIIYGDDLTADELSLKLSSLRMGISTNWSKSFWVKKDGLWRKNLKFLGLETDGTKIWGATRKGSTLIYNKEKLIDLINARREDARLEKLGIKRTIFKDYPYENDLNKVNQPSLIHLIKSELWGLIQNRLYTNEYEDSNIVQNFNLNYIEGSWMSFREKWIKQKGLTVFNSTSYAYRSLYGMLKKVKYNGISNKRRDDWAHVNLEDNPIIQEQYAYEWGVDQDLKRYQHMKLYWKAMAKEAKSNQEKIISERASKVSPNRRERVRSKLEEQRRIKTPIYSVWYGEAYYNFLKWYQSLIISIEKAKDDNLFDTHKIVFTEEESNEGVNYNESANQMNKTKEKANNTENSQEYLKAVYGYINSANKIIYDNWQLVKEVDSFINTIWESRKDNSIKKTRDKAVDTRIVPNGRYITETEVIYKNIVNKFNKLINSDLEGFEVDWALQFYAFFIEAFESIKDTDQLRKEIHSTASRFLTKVNVNDKVNKTNDNAILLPAPNQTENTSRKKIYVKKLVTPKFNIMKSNKDRTEIRIFSGPAWPGLTQNFISILWCNCTCAQINQSLVTWKIKLKEAFNFIFSEEKSNTNNNNNHKFIRNELEKEFFSKGDIHTVSEEDIANWIKSIKRSNFFKKSNYYPNMGQILRWKLKNMLAETKQIVIFSYRTKQVDLFEADFHKWARMLHYIGIFLAYKIFEVPEEWSEIKDWIKYLWENEEIENRKEAEDKEENKVIYWFLILTITCIAGATIHWLVTQEINQNAILESIVREQASENTVLKTIINDQTSIIEGQRITLELQNK